MTAPEKLFHFSENPNITTFNPHIAPSSSEPEPYVWAIDEEHCPSYWFPRDCPRACCWTNSPESTLISGTLLGLGGVRRMHAIEAIWLERMRSCRIFAYEFAAGTFRQKISEAGYWVTSESISPLSVTPVGDLLSRHVAAGIELRIVKSLWPLIDAIVTSGLEFSIIRKSNAQKRRAEARRGVDDAAAIL